MKINYRKFIEDNFFILDSQTQTPVPFKLNAVQNKYLNILETEYKNMEGIREIILKARQEGFSSFILALFAVDFLVRPYSISICISHRKDSTELLFKKVKFYIESYLQKLSDKKGVSYDTLIKSFFKTDNKGMLENATNSAMFYIGTAGAKVGGRGGSARNIHFCVGGKTLLIHPNGLTTKMEDIKIGDSLISNNGEETRVVNKWNTGVKKVKEIRLWLGNERVWTTPEHKVKTIDGWKRVSELTTKDFIEWSVPVTKENISMLSFPTIPHCIHLSTNDYFYFPADQRTGYFLGYYLAEGTISKNMNRLEFTCHKDEVFYKKFISLFPYLPTIKTRTDPHGTRKTITYNSRELATFVEKLVGRTTEKRVPTEFLKFYSKDFLRGLYRGWKDGDGSKTRKDVCYITTIRERIARQMRQIVAMTDRKILSLDFYPNRSRYGKQTKPVYVLREHNKGNNLGKRSLKYKEKGGKLFIRVKSVLEAENQPTYEIEVSHPDHSFLTVAGLQSNSEAAFYQDTELITAQEIIIATAQQVPQGSGMIFIESTANGEGNFYHGEWERSQPDGTGSVYKPRFFGWQEFYTPEWIEEKKKEFPSEKLAKQEYPNCLTGETLVGGKGVEENGEILKNINRIENGSAPVFKIITKNGRVLRVTKNHLLFTGEQYKRVSEFLVGEKITLLPFQPHDYSEVKIDLKLPCLSPTIKIDEEWGEFLGLYMGDGSFYGKSSTLSIVCDKKDQDVVNRCSFLLDKLFGKSTPRIVGSKMGGIEVRVNNIRLKDIFMSLDIIKKRNSDDKLIRNIHVPNYLFNSPLSVIRCFLRGLFEADGFVGYKSPRIVLFSRHEDFLRQIQLLLLYFGINSSIKIADKKHPDGHVYTGRELRLNGFQVKKFSREVGFISKRKNSRFESHSFNGVNTTKNEMFDYIVSIEKDGKEKVFNLTTYTHYYSANGIWVHNSPEEAFITSGSPYFDVQILDDMMKEKKVPTEYGRVAPNGHFI